MTATKSPPQPIPEETQHLIDEIKLLLELQSAGIIVGVFTGKDADRKHAAFDRIAWKIGELEGCEG